MSDWVTSFVETVGYPGIVVLMILEIPLPIIQSEIVMTFSGFAASRGDLDPVLVVVAGVAGSTIGSVALFAVARSVPEPAVKDFLERHGGWLGFTRENLESAQDRFRRHDHWAVLVGRLIPGIRSFIAIPAGFTRMPYWEFIALNLVGTVFWISVLTYLGSILGENYGLVDQYSSYITYGLLGAAAAYVLYRIGVVAMTRASDT
ncbi:DedA family protein [Rhabdothermincola salaria]|uniref:DedA family protein n=1 Tax=Rhabdothermincola salaria TaxID=2903142 RepID=UPI001E5C5BA5|nr:DedA family protein [Rhabdothermincola salaria]MCD9625676.1 DedA family protein [Rhabdothermincola salaria]